MICQNCKADLPGEFKFCPSCGSPVVQQKSFCPNCGKPAEAGWNACPFCGQKLISQPGQPVQPAQPAPTPPQQTYYEPRHGYHHGSSSDHRYGHQRKKGFLGKLFSS